jgi:hypothetical protein
MASELLGHALVSVPYWEWIGYKGALEREQYLRGKLEARPRHEIVYNRNSCISSKCTLP